MSNRSSGIWIFLFVIGLVLGIWLNIYYYDWFAYPSIIGIIWFVVGLVVLSFLITAMKQLNYSKMNMVA